MLCLKNATFIDWRTFRVTRGHLALTQGPSGEARFVDRPPRGARVLDCSGRIVNRGGRGVQSPADLLGLELESNPGKSDRLS